MLEECPSVASTAIEEFLTIALMAINILLII